MDKQTERLIEENKRLRRELEAANQSENQGELPMEDSDPQELKMHQEQNAAVFNAGTEERDKSDNDNTSESESEPREDEPSTAVAIANTVVDKAAAPDTSNSSQSVEDKVQEIHRMVSEVHSIVTQAAPAIQDFLTTVQTKGIAGIFQDMFKFGK